MSTTTTVLAVLRITVTTDDDDPRDGQERAVDQAREIADACTMAGHGILRHVEHIDTQVTDVAVVLP